MTFTPIAPTIYVAPTQVAPETFVIHQIQEALGAPLFVYLNSMVIRGKEPVIVDTGTPANRKQWLEDVFALVWKPANAAVPGFAASTVEKKAAGASEWKP